jgi:phage terminase large subunit-like protein
MAPATATAIAKTAKRSRVSAAALAAGTPACLHPEPEWITRAADEYGYAWARVEWRRAAAVEGAWFDAAKADAVVAMWPRTFCLTTKRFAGKPFRLAFWQELIVRLFVGWKRPIEVLDEDSGLPTTLHVRLFQELRLWIPRKNGKSEFLAALALLFWALEGEVRGQGFCFAHDEAQAREVFDKMGDMVAYTPTLAQDVRVLSKTLWIQKLKSPFRLLPGKVKGKHGRAPTVTVGDEMHEWPSRTLSDTLRQGEGTSLQPARLYASTAGLRSQLVGKELWDESLAILDGRIEDPTTLIVIFAAADESDWRDEKVWAQANPSLGLSPTLQFLRSEFAKAQTPSGEAAFRRYHLNQWVEDLTRWLPLKKWDACAPDKQAWKRWQETDELDGRECVLAFDSTWSFDFAAMVLRFKPIEAGEHPKFLFKFWLPSETIEQRVRAEQVPFDRWRDAGAIEEVPGGVFSGDWAVKAAREYCQRFNVSKIGWDSWGAKEFYNRLVNPPAGDDATALPEDLFTEMRFGTRTLGEASREFERRVYAGELGHGGHPVARWMAGHCHVRFDENMNFVPAKKKSGQKNSIDGIVAGVMDEALAMVAADGPSVYEQRGIVEIEI